MTGRGPLRPEELRPPITPPDPTLTTRPVPETRSFAVRSFAPATNSDIRTSARSMRELEEAADPMTYHEGPDWYFPTEDPVHKLLGAIENWKNVENDPSWGFYVFVTAYSDTARDRLPQAMENWVKAVQKSVSYYTLPIYAEEAFRRFKFNVIEDQEALDGASIDRVREEFPAQIKG